MSRGCFLVGQQVTLIALLLCLAASRPAAAVTPGDAWPGFRGDGSSTTAAQNLPEQWAADHHIAWTYDLPGQGQSAPVVHEGVVYVTSAQEDAGKIRDGYQVIAIDIATGEAKWWTGFTATQRDKLDGQSTRAAPTPVVAADGLYVFFESGDLAALDLDGEVRWQRALTTEYGEIESSFGLSASLALTPKAVVVLIDHSGQSYLLLADRATGKTILKKDRDTKRSYSSPVVVDADTDTPRLLVSSEGGIGELDLATGDAVWTLIGGAEGICTPVIGNDGLVVIADAWSETAVAVQRGGEGNINHTRVLWRLDEFSNGYHSPLIVNNRVYMATHKGELYCINAATGAKLWTHMLNGSLWTAPIAAGDRIYCFTEKGKTHVLVPDDEGPGELAVNDLPTESRVYGVAPVDGAMLIRTADKLICVGKPRQKAADGTE